ncbi:MAG: helix-turn-helix domain-containing protein [Bacillota bacterium]
MIKITLGESLKELALTQNKFAVTYGFRPNTINDFVNGNVKRADFDTLDKMVNSLNHYAKKMNIQRHFTLSDVFIHVDESQEEPKDLLI